VVWRLRRSPLVRAALGWVAKICVGMLGIVAVVTLFFVWAFGHPVAWSVIGCLFAVVPLAGLVVTVGVGLRAAVVAGPGRIAVRFFGRWRVVDLGQVRAVRFAEGGSMGGFGGFGGAGGFGGGRFGGPGGSGRGGGSRALVFEDVHGGQVEIGVEALEAGLAEVVREGLGPDVVIDADVAGALGGSSFPAGPTAETAALTSETAEPDPQGPEQEIGHRP